MFSLSRMRERVGVRARLNQRFEDAFKHRLCPLQRLIIPEPNHAKPRTREVQRSLQILDHRVHVLSAIELNDQTRANADEVDDISTDRHLPSKSVTAQTAMPQVIPQTPFGIGRVQAQSACVCEE